MFYCNTHIAFDGEKLISFIFISGPAKPLLWKLLCSQTGFSWFSLYCLSTGMLCQQENYFQKNILHPCWHNFVTIAMPGKVLRCRGVITESRKSALICICKQSHEWEGDLTFLSFGHHVMQNDMQFPSSSLLAKYWGAVSPCGTAMGLQVVLVQWLESSGKAGIYLHWPSKKFCFWWYFNSKSFHKTMTIRYKTLMKDDCQIRDSLWKIRLDKSRTLRRNCVNSILKLNREYETSLAATKTLLQSRGTSKICVQGHLKHSFLIFIFFLSILFLDAPF